MTPLSVVGRCEGSELEQITQDDVGFATTDGFEMQVPRGQVANSRVETLSITVIIVVGFEGPEDLQLEPLERDGTKVGEVEILVVPSSEFDPDRELGDLAEESRRGKVAYILGREAGLDVKTLRLDSRALAAALDQGPRKAGTGRGLP
jgi:hypothetical protein